ncbi:hypothetical protein [Nostoc sp.]
MTDSTLNRPAVFIEKMIPVQVLNEEVNFEHGVIHFENYIAGIRVSLCHYKSGGKIYEN